MTTKFNVNAPVFTPSSDEPKRRTAAKKPFAKPTVKSQTGHPNGSQGACPRYNHVQRRTDASIGAAQGSSGIPGLDPLVSTSGRNKRGQVDISHIIELRPRRPPVNRPAGRRRRLSNHEEPIDQTTYINATYRFVLDSRASYTNLLKDPDIPVPMDKVMRVIMSQPSACPICLEDVPEAPRMLECGHVLCYPCIFRYLDSEGVGKDLRKPHRNCPLCMERLRLETLKPVKFLFGYDRFDIPKEDHKCILRLMVRPIGTLFAIPRDTAFEPFNFDEIPSVHNPTAFRHSRLLSGDDNYSNSEYQAEIQQLKHSREQNKVMYDDDGKYHTIAINMIYKIIQLQSRDIPIESFSPLPAITVGGYRIEGDVSASIRDEMEHMSVTAVGKDAVSGSSRQPAQDIHNYNDDTAYFFYQTAFESVTKFFLSTLDSRILRTAFGSYSAFPSVLVPKVEHIRYGVSVNSDIRKRMKYLGHLPDRTAIAFLECDWSEVLDRAVLQKFSKELSQRRRIKRERELRDERNRQRHERTERQQLEYELYQECGYSSGPQPGTLQSSRTLDPELDLPALPSRPTESEDPDTGPAATLPRKPAWVTNGPSFAQAASTKGDAELQRMLEQAKPDRRGRKKLVLMSTSRAV